jgi:hypothetical protein
VQSHLAITENKSKLRKDWFFHQVFSAGTVFPLSRIAQAEDEHIKENVRGAIAEFEVGAGVSQQGPIARYVYVGMEPTADIGLPIFKYDRLEFTSSEIRLVRIYPIVELIVQIQLRDGIYTL